MKVWSASLDQPEWCLQKLKATLAAEEIERAGRFVQEVHCRRFIAGRGMLRTLLSSYVNLEPAQIRFSYGAHGKPEITNGDAGKEIRFNVSHSRDRVLYAVGRRTRVGVDIEHVRPVSNLSEVARRFFSPWENTALHALREEDRLAAFFRCWTRKEALVKARGEGISGYLSRFDVSLAPGDPARLLNVEGWNLKDVPMGSGYVAAVVRETHA